MGLSHKYANIILKNLRLKACREPFVGNFDKFLSVSAPFSVLRACISALPGRGLLQYADASDFGALCLFGRKQHIQKTLTFAILPAISVS